MKKIISLTLISLCVGATGYSAPFMAIGDGAEIFVTGLLGVRADDNILLGSGAAAVPAVVAAPGITARAAVPASPKTSDTIFDFSPGLELTFGKNAQLKGALTLVDAFARYSSHSKLNTNLFSGDFVTRFDDGKTKMGANAGYHELNQNTVDVRGLIRRDVFNAGANGEVEVSQVTSIGGGVQFVHTNYHPATFADSDDLVVPLNVYYKLTPKVDLSAGYRYRDYQTNIGQDSTDHFFNVGARGEFSPKFTGTVAVGYTKRKLSSAGPLKAGDNSLLGLDASFAYEFTPKSTFQFGASNDFGTSPAGQQQKNLTLNAGVTTKISDEWSLNAGLSWRAIDYGTRTDDFLEARVGATYVINANVSLTGGYTYRKYTSDLVGSEFKNNVFNVAANFRY